MTSLFRLSTLTVGTRAATLPRLLAAAVLPALILLGALGTAGPAHAASGAPVSAHSRVRTVELTTPFAARATDPAGLAVRATPRVATPVVTLPAATTFGTPRVLLATARRGSWYRVLLPTRPNGSTGWVRAVDVTVRPLPDVVRVDLAARSLTWTRHGAVVLTTPVAIGAPETPTPAGAFFVTDLLQNAEPAGAYGPFALGLSAHSDTLSEFAGGDGQIGIHGTDAPWSIGQAVSHGCVRVPDDVVDHLAHGLPLGTPVVIG
jgi:lipoprotein-anchoring transpeptidase ErfK/SrfK